MVGSSTVIHWARGQPVIAMSSGEAEFYSIVSLISELIALQSFCLDWNFQFGIGVNSDATAAMAMSQRRGLGRAKHIDTQHLWLQEAVKEKRLTVAKVGMNANTADMFTKQLAERKMVEYMTSMHCVSQYVS